MKKALKFGLIAASIMLATACSKNHGSADVSNGGMFANGLGQNTRFPGQEEGEMYTTKAPHNQVYLFSYDDSALDQKYLASANAQAQYLREHPAARVLIAGHTDERGSREYNIALGERRAQTVAQIMHMSGVKNNQIRVVSYGKERPVYFGHDEASHKQNRRVEFTYEATQ